MKIKIYTLGFIASDDIELEEHSFDSKSDSDMNILEDFFDETDFDPEFYNNEDFEVLCKYYVTENRHQEYAQQFINCLVLTEKELNTLKKTLKNHLI